jgi:hypothetical protein
MLIAFKFVGATVLAGALAASGVITTDQLTERSDKEDSVAATVVAQPPAAADDGTTTTTTEPPTTTTTAPPTIALPPPVQPTAIPVAGAGTVVIVLQGPVIVVREVKAVPGWIASIEQRSGDIVVLFRKGDRSFRFFAGLKDRRLNSAIREVRFGDDHRDGFDGRRWDGWNGWDGHRDSDGRRDRH